ncbi:serine O-acetyltransferase [Parvularcula sp. LCG005]|uniref:serine O-acetyltransferase n=1 Tax=Parvularcula sp. LCG005 TaxID=3078805 RepID=UPI002942914C|nr:serine O-acetyltransferase [Parvularcula sp. LCG005]WOI52650.1 serine O-acetyltransferase [Parvularcula sp. LCG005]
MNEARNILQMVHPLDASTVWSRLSVEARTAAEEEPVLASFLNATVLHHDTFEAALSYRLAQKLSDNEMNAMLWRDVAMSAYAAEPEIVHAALEDMLAYYQRDPACKQLTQPFLYFKGFHAVQSYRVANWLYRQGRGSLAFYLQSRMSELFAIDINPAARLGKGLFIDHGHGIVIGETARVGDNVSMLHGVTLGGTGKDNEDRHPKIGNNVLIGAGAKILGNIKVGNGAKVAAGSVVLEEVPELCTVAGVPAKPVGKCCGNAAQTMDQKI